MTQQTFRPIDSDVTREGYPVVHISQTGEPFTIEEAQTQVDATTEPGETQPILYIDRAYIRDQMGRVYGERTDA